MDMTVNIYNELRSGARVNCLACSSGEYKPINGIKPECCYTFVCNKCGERMIFSPRLDLSRIRKKYLSEHSNETGASFNQ